MKLTCLTSAICLAAILFAANSFAQVVPPPVKCTYVKGKYECADFAVKYNAECAILNVQSWGLALFVGPNSPPGCESHALNIVSITSPPGPNSQYPSYCAVEPQNGWKSCWQQFSLCGGPIVPKTVITAIMTDDLGKPQCQVVDTKITSQDIPIIGSRPGNSTGDTAGGELLMP